MKILGETKIGFLVDLTETEIANLTGYSSSYSGGFKKPKISDEYNIEEIFKRIESVIRLRSELEDLDKRLTTLKSVTKNGIQLFEPKSGD